MPHGGGTSSRAAWRCPHASAVGLGAGTMMTSITLEKKKTLLGSAAPAGVPEPGTHRNKWSEARWKKELGLGFH